MRLRMKMSKLKIKENVEERNGVIEGEGEKRRTNVLKVETARLEIRRNFFTIRAANTWNNIPDFVREKKTVNGFKNAYDKWKGERPDEV